MPCRFHFSNYTSDETWMAALISHILASELAFENGNLQFLISKIIDFSDKKKCFIFDGVFNLVDGIFWHLIIYNTPHDFWELSKTVFITFLVHLGLILEEGACDAPPPPQKKDENYAHRNRVKVKNGDQECTNRFSSDLSTLIETWFLKLDSKLDQIDWELSCCSLISLLFLSEKDGIIKRIL